LRFACSAPNSFCSSGPTAISSRPAFERIFVFGEEPDIEPLLAGLRQQEDVLPLDRLELATLARGLLVFAGELGEPARIDAVAIIHDVLLEVILFGAVLVSATELELVLSGLDGRHINLVGRARLRGGAREQQN
jgi:hypothetical protein